MSEQTQQDEAQEGTVRCYFTREHVVEDYREGTDQEVRYEEGKDYRLPEASAVFFQGLGKARILAEGQSPEDLDGGRAPEPDVSDYHVGGGMYELPGGKRVRGKNKALEALGAQG